MLDYRLYSDDYTISVSCVNTDEGFGRGTVECNLGISFLLLLDNPPNFIKEFQSSKRANVTRIVVSEEMRNQGIGTELMNRLCAYADSQGVLLDLCINPYGDLNYEQLVQFYSKFGFVKYEDTEVYYRIPKINKNAQANIYIVTQDKCIIHDCTDIEGIIEILSQVQNPDEVACYTVPIMSNDIIDNNLVTLVVWDEEKNAMAFQNITWNQAKFIINHTKTGEEYACLDLSMKINKTELLQAIEDDIYQCFIKLAQYHKYILTTT